MPRSYVWKSVGTARSVCLNPKFPGSCLKLRVYKCKDICYLVDNIKYKTYISNKENKNGI